jgi:hypothetical protein
MWQQQQKSIHVQQQLKTTQAWSALTAAISAAAVPAMPPALPLSIMKQQQQADSASTAYACKPHRHGQPESGIHRSDE